MHARHTHILAAIVAFAMPLSALAAPVVVIDDTIAGLGATAEVKGAPPSAALDVVFTTPDGARTVSVATGNDGTAVAELATGDTETAGTYRAALMDGKTTLTQTSFSVLPDSIDPLASTMNADRRTLDPDGADAAEVTVHLVDRYGNPLPRRPVTLVAGRSDDRIDALGSQTDLNGEQHFLVSTTARGRVALRAIDLLSGNVLEDTVTIDAGAPAYGGLFDEPGASWEDQLLGRSYTAQVSGGFDVVQKFKVTAPKELPRNEEAAKLTITALDAKNNTVQNYAGTVVFSSTDPDAVLPNFGEYTFKARDLGQKEFPLILKFKTTGEQVFRVEDKTDTSIAGEAVINVVRDTSSNPTGVIVLTSPKDGDTVAGSTVTVEGKGPEYANITIYGGAQEVEDDTDSDGKFSVVVPLDTSMDTATLRAEDDSGDFVSPEVTVRLDKDAPEIKDVTFEPETPTEGQNTLVRVQSETGLPSVVMSFVTKNGEKPTEVTLQENNATPGTYQAFFAAPAAGSYQPTVVVTDDGGNRSDLRVNLRVALPGLPKVQNVEADPRANAIALSWDPLAEEVSFYRIYVGDSPESFAYTLETGKPVTQATVAGLSAGTTYYFAVTAVRDGIESTEKSDVIDAEVLGLNLETEPRDASIKLTWEFPEDAPVSSFLLEYGEKPGQYTERRIINGALRTHTMPDLINGLTYFIRLTPVATTGTRMDEMSETDDDTPNGPLSGFRAGTSDPVPFDPAAANLTSVPEHSKEGVPSWVFFTTLGIAAIIVLRRTRRRYTVA